MPGDYDGDGMTDLATYTRATGLWRVFLSSTWREASVTFGTDATRPVPGDYDGDGATDIADERTDLAAFGGSLYKLLAERGHTVDHARAVLAPVNADAELAELLHVPVGAPLQHLRQVDHDTAGRPVMLSLEWHVPDVIELRVYRRGPGPQPVG